MNIDVEHRHKLHYNASIIDKCLLLYAFLIPFPFSLAAHRNISDEHGGLEGAAWLYAVPPVLLRHGGFRRLRQLVPLQQLDGGVQLLNHRAIQICQHLQLPLQVYGPDTDNTNLAKPIPIPIPLTGPKSIPIPIPILSMDRKSIPIPIPILGNLGFSIPKPIPILAKTPILQYQYQYRGWILLHGILKAASNRPCKGK